jgi:hypothetical protein
MTNAGPLVLAGMIVLGTACGGEPLVPADAASDGDLARLDGDIASDAGAPPDGDPAIVRDATPAVDDDRDDDGVPDGEDAFPDDPLERFDSDGDGVGNLADEDEDEDGVPDLDDEAPFDPAASRYPRITEIERNDARGSAQALAPAELPFVIAGAFGAAFDGDHFALALPDDSGFTVSAVPSEGVHAELIAWLSGTTDRRLFAIDEPSSASPAPGAPIVRSFLAPSAASGPVVIALTDVGETPSVAPWEMTWFRDDDLDGADDARELALGLDPARHDTDGDSLPDGIELAAPRDPDGDGVPTFFDTDADGDGVEDALEGAGDPDRDGRPSFADTDSDDDGAPDSLVAGDPSPPDSDGDLVPDFLDLDDDDDDVLDVEDADDLVRYPLPAASGTTRPMAIDTVHTILDTGEQLDGAGVEGETMVIGGAGLPSDPALALVLFGGSDAPVNVRPTTASATELRVTVPPGAGTRVSVLVGTVRTAPIPFDFVAAGAPILFPLAEPSIDVGYFGAVGRNLAAVTEVTIDGLPGGFSYRTETEMTVGIFRSGEVRAANRLGRSNRIHVDRLTETYTAYLVPAGAVAAARSLVISGGVSAATTPSPPDTSVRISFDETEPDLITAIAPLGAGARDCVTLMAIPVRGAAFFDWRVTTTSTAMALALLGSDAIGRVAPESRQALEERLALRPEIATLASRLDAVLATTACPIDAPDATTTAAIRAAIAAADAVVDEGLAAGTITRPLPIRLDSVITPMEQEDFLVRQVAGTGHVEVENDSQLYASARITDPTQQRTYLRHIEHPFDLRIIRTQSGLLTGLRAEQTNLLQPDYRNARLELLTAGTLAPSPGVAEIDAYFDVFLRTTLDRIVAPTIGIIVGRLVDMRPLYQILLGQYWEGLIDVRSTFLSGDAGGGASRLLELITRDLEGVGPITRWLVTATFQRFAPDLAARLAAKAIPIFGQLKALVDAVADAATAIGIAKTVHDMATTPAVLVYDIDFGFQVTGVTPGVISRELVDTELRIDGSNLGRRRDPETGMLESPVVIVRDATTGVERELAPSRIAENESWLRVILPDGFVASAQGPLSITVRRGSESAVSPEGVRVAFDLELERVDPPAAGPGEIVTILGGGFGTDVTRIRALFHGPAWPEGDVAHRARIVSLDRSEMRVIVPSAVLAGRMYEVSVQRGTDAGPRFDSNRVPFNPQFPPLTGRWEGTNLSRRCYPEPERYDIVYTCGAPDPTLGGIVEGVPLERYCVRETRWWQYGIRQLDRRNVEYCWMDDPASPSSYGLVHLSCASLGDVSIHAMSPDGRRLYWQDSGGEPECIFGPYRTSERRRVD